MTKKEIVKIISDETGMSQLQTREVVERVLKVIVDSVIQDGRVELRNFGVFEIKTRKQRLVRNPNSNEMMEIPAKDVVVFKPGKELEEKIASAREMKNRWKDVLDPPAST
jgi:nucleoid DNA-binding protein